MPAPVSHLRIVYLCVATHLGGAERSLFDLVSRLEASTEGWYRPHLILPRAEGELVEALRAAGLSHEVLPMPAGLLRLSRARPLRSGLGLLLGGLQLRGYLRRLRARLDELQPALVHSTGIKCHLLAAELVPRWRVLWHLRDILAEGPLLRLLRRRARRPGLQIIANSVACARAFDPHLGAEAVVYNGIDAERFAPGDDGGFRRRHGIPTDRPLVGIVGVLQRGKGLDDFVDMAAELVRQGSPADFCVIGGSIYDTRRDQDYRASLEQQAAAAGLRGRMHFVGQVADPVPALRSLDILVSAARHPESFGRSMVEAQLCGLGVVAAAHGGALEIIRDGEDGLLYPPGSVAALRAAVAGLLADPARRALLGAAGRERARARFGLDGHVQAVVRAYDRALSPAPLRTAGGAP